MNVRGIQKSFPRTTTTNKPFLRPLQRSLAVKNDLASSSAIAEAVLFAIAVFYQDEKPSLIRSVSKRGFS